MTEATPLRPTDFAEEHIVAAILDGTYPPGYELPNQHKLASQLGIARPSLREALQRLARDGWITIRHGKPSVVKDIWRDGGLNVLTGIIRHYENAPPDIVTRLLEVRAEIAPAYTSAAADKSPDKVISILEEGLALKDTPEAFAEFDWHLHHTLTILSGNPVYPLLLNSFANFYIELALSYFSDPKGRKTSLTFYDKLKSAIESGSGEDVEQIVSSVMKESIRIWKRVAKEAGSVD